MSDIVDVIIKIMNNIKVNCDYAGHEQIDNMLTGIVEGSFNSDILTEKSSDGTTILDAILAHGGYDKTLGKIIEKYPEIITWKDENGNTPLHNYVNEWNSVFNFVEAFRDHQDILKMQNNDGDTIAHILANHGYEGELLAFFKYDPNLIVDILNNEKRSVLHIAAGIGCVHLVNAVFAKVPNALTMKDKYGNTPLHYAIKYGNDEIIEKVIKDYPHMLGVQNNKSETPLHWAAGSDRDFRNLLEKARVADSRLLEIKDDECDTPCDVYRKKHGIDIDKKHTL